MKHKLKIWTFRGAGTFNNFTFRQSKPLLFATASHLYDKLCKPNARQQLHNDMKEKY